MLTASFVKPGSSNVAETVLVSASSYKSILDEEYEYLCRHNEWCFAYPERSALGEFWRLVDHPLD